jgi:hypothetical protein
MQESSTIWIYSLSDPRFPGIVRYVGQSKNPTKRLRSHVQDARGEPGNHRRYWLRTLIEAGVKPALTLIEECSEEAWQIRERHWIAYYRSLGCDLVNSTDGGEEHKTLCMESRAKISQSNKGRLKGIPLSPEHRAKIGKAQIGKKMSPESRARMSAFQKGRTVSDERRARQAEIMRHRPRSAESIAKGAEKRAGHYMLMSPEGKQFEVKGLGGFCREHGLHRGNMLSLLAGRIQYNNGWRIWRPGEPVPPAPIPKSVRMSEQFRGRDLGSEWRAKISAARSMSFIATTPAGIEIHGSNLTAFCATHGLNRCSMQRILNGQADQVKGWRIRRPET